MAEQPKKFLRFKQLRERVSLSHSTIYEQIAKGKFPRPHKIGVRAVAWLESDVQDWIESRISARGSQ